MNKKLKITDLSPDPRNANKGTERGRNLLENSLSKLGAGRSIVCDKHGTVIGGNKTLEQAQKLGLEIEVIHTQGDKLVAVIRDDLDLETDSRARELAYADNRVAELDLDWDVDQILSDINSFSLEGLWSEVELERLQDGVDLAAFEALASSSDESTNESNNESNEADELTTSSKTDSDLLPFHCLLSQTQRERLFQAINQAKTKHGFETTAEALNAIAEDYLSA